MRILLLTFALLIYMQNAQALDSNSENTVGAKHCGLGEVQSTLEAFEVGIFYAGPFPNYIKIAGLGGSVDCQYRLFLPQKPTNGEPFTFCEDDLFLGGIVLFYPYQLLGLSREYAVSDLEQVDSEVYFGPKDGIQTKQTLIRTGYKGFLDPALGLTVGTQHAFITQQDPGIYVSNFTQYYMGAPVGNVVAEIVVVSHEEHLDRVAEGAWRKWD